MIDAIAGPLTTTRQETAAPAAESAAADGGAQTAPTVDFQSFLQLLTAQLRYQDPLAPLDSTQFVAQLAGFSTVEQLVNANRRLDDIAAQLAAEASAPAPAA